MAIPPIISNSPIFKIFQSDNAKSKTDKTESAAQSPQDVVEISEAAQQRLNNIQDFSAENQVFQNGHQLKKVLSVLIDREQYRKHRVYLLLSIRKTNN